MAQQQPFTGHTIADYEDALLHCAACCTHDEWFRLLAAAKSAGVAQETALQWSASCEDAFDPRTFRSTWNSIKPDGGIKPGTLIAIAQSQGWQHKRQPKACKPTARRVPNSEPPRRVKQEHSAAAIYQRTHQAGIGHGYFVNKGFVGLSAPDGVRVWNFPTHPTGGSESANGALLVPVIGSTGLTSLQIIYTGTAAGDALKASGEIEKRNLPGHTLGDGWFVIGELESASKAYVCEGICSAWTANLLTGNPAIVTFGVGRTRTVLERLKAQHGAIKPVLVADAGQEKAFLELASRYGGGVVCMPEASPANFDINDFWQDDPDAAKALLSEPTEFDQPQEIDEEPSLHRLNKFVHLDGKAKAPRWVIPGFIGQGVTVISGSQGVGKTTAILPLALTAAGLHGGELMPRHWRHVVYISEDIEQVQRILTGITDHSGIGVTVEDLRERLHLVEAVRMDPYEVARAGDPYRKQFTRVVDGVEIPPLVVLDTKSAVLESEDENNNSEASRMMAALKQGFSGLPVWLIGHVAKTDINRVENLTSRGANAIEADANQTIFLIRDKDRRYLKQGKTRFEPKWSELEITTDTAKVTAEDEFGFTESVLLRWGLAKPPTQSRSDAAATAQEQKRKEDEASLRQEVRDAVDTAWRTGMPLNRTGVKSTVRRKASEVHRVMITLLSERWLYEVTITEDRVVNSKATFLVNLTTEEREALISHGTLPDDKLFIPPSLRKQKIPAGSKNETKQALAAVTG